MANLNSTQAQPTPAAKAVTDALKVLQDSVQVLHTANALIAVTPAYDLFTVLQGISTATANVAEAAGELARVAAAADPSVAPGTTAAAPAPPQVPVIRMAGPWIAGQLYGVVPHGPLVAVPDNGEKWFAITRGRYVGLTKNSTISLHGTTGMSSGLADKCASQADALEHFNGALSLGAIAVLTS
ncbi:hypothetical protein C8R47DRAFT_1084494 [Mycena vitilis]|nr:hypothetical protein C8R47DRAFT_1084494 [Mycena vitilis]